MSYTPQNWASGSWVGDAWALNSWGGSTPIAQETTPARTAAGGPTGTRHRKRYLFPTPEEIQAEEAAIVAQALAAVPEEDDTEMLDAVAAFLAHEDLF